MKYFNISADYDPKTTGKRDGTCAVNQKKNKLILLNFPSSKTCFEP